MAGIRGWASGGCAPDREFGAAGPGLMDAGAGPNPSWLGRTPLTAQRAIASRLCRTSASTVRPSPAGRVAGRARGRCFFCCRPCSGTGPWCGSSCVGCRRPFVPASGSTVLLKAQRKKHNGPVQRAGPVRQQPGQSWQSRPARSQREQLTLRCCASVSRWAACIIFWRCGASAPAGPIAEPEKKGQECSVANRVGMRPEKPG